MILSLVAYAADAFILGTYIWSARWPQRVRWFHAANALGFAPLVAIEIIQGAYPVLPLTLVFGVAGAYGWWRVRPVRGGSGVGSDGLDGGW